MPTEGDLFCICYAYWMLNYLSRVHVFKSCSGKCIFRYIYNSSRKKLELTISMWLISISNQDQDHLCLLCHLAFRSVDKLCKVSSACILRWVSHYKYRSVNGLSHNKRDEGNFTSYTTLNIYSKTATALWQNAKWKLSEEETSNKPETN